jgi:hypothetical protein
MAQSELTLDELEALADAATPGPWTRHGKQLRSEYVDPLLAEHKRFELANFINVLSYWPRDQRAKTLEAQAQANAEFCRAARTAVPALIQRARMAEVPPSELTKYWLWRLDSYHNKVHDLRIENERLKVTFRESAAMNVVKALGISNDTPAVLRLWRKQIRSGLSPSNALMQTWLDGVADALAEYEEGER